MHQSSLELCLECLASLEQTWEGESPVKANEKDT